MNLQREVPENQPTPGKPGEKGKTFVEKPKHQIEDVKSWSERLQLASKSLRSTFQNEAIYESCQSFGGILFVEGRRVTGCAVCIGH